MYSGLNDCERSTTMNTYIYTPCFTGYYDQLTSWCGWLALPVASGLMPGMQSSTILPGPGSQSPGCLPSQPQWPPRCGKCDLNSRMMECRPLAEHFSHCPQSGPSLAANHPRSGRRGQWPSLDVSSKLGWPQPGTNRLPLLQETPTPQPNWSVFDRFRNTLSMVGRLAPSVDTSPHARWVAMSNAVAEETVISPERKKTKKQDNSARHIMTSLYRLVIGKRGVGGGPWRALSPYACLHELQMG